MAVAFDAVGSATGFKSTTSPLTFTHTAGAGGSVVLVEATVDGNTTVTATYGGASMTLLGSKASDNVASNGIVWLFGITGQTSGAKSVSISTTTGFTVILGNSISFTGASGFGAAVTNFGSSASATVTVTGTTSGNMVFGAGASGTQTGGATFTSGTSRFVDPDNGGNGVGNMFGGTIAAGGSVSVTATISNDVWAMVGAEVQGAAGPTPGPSVGQRDMPQRIAFLVSNSGWRGAGHSR